MTLDCGKALTESQQPLPHLNLDPPPSGLGFDPVLCGGTTSRPTGFDADDGWHGDLLIWIWGILAWLGDETMGGRGVLYC